MLNGKRVAAIITDGYHNTELTDPVKALKKEGAEVSIIGVKQEHLTMGVLDHLSYKLPDELKPKERIKADKLINDVNAKDYDALLIPGGNAPEPLRIIPEVIGFVLDFYAAGKPIAAICHGPQVLISADILKGKNATCVKTIAVDLKNAGAIYLDKPLVIDSNIITSRTPADMEHFIKGLIDSLK